MEREGNQIILIVATVVIFLITLFVIGLFIFFQKRKNKLLQEQKDAKKRFEQEIADTQIEIREQTLRNISWELHDNIGQLLTLAKIQLQNATSENYSDVGKTISQGLQEIRSLSKIINPDVIKNIKLYEAIQMEIDRFNRLNFIKSKLCVQGDVKVLDAKPEIIIFRMLQEFFSNTIKHSKASTLNVNLEYTENQLKITAQDNGVGFDHNKQSYDGIGLQNMKSRAKLINAELDLISEIDFGTTLTIIYYL